MDSDPAAFNIRAKKLFVAGVDDDILEEIYNFPFPTRRMTVDQLHAVTKRLENSKATLGLTSLECHCLFNHRYLLPRKHTFHEHIYGEARFLTADAWKTFQILFEESEFEVYENRVAVEIERRQQAINELMERTRDAY